MCLGTFPTQQPYTVGVAPIGIATADFNGDGCPDLVVANDADNDFNGTVDVLIGSVTNGSCDGTFPSQKTTAAGYEPWAAQRLAISMAMASPILVVTNATVDGSGNKQIDKQF